MGVVWAGQREQRSAGVRGADVKGTGRTDDQPLYDRLWGSGFLPSKYQGVKFRNGGDPVLYLSNPNGVSAEVRRETLDEIGALNAQHLGVVGDPEISTRIAQYEMAFRMQTSVPELTDTSKEPANIVEMYGPNVKKPGRMRRIVCWLGGCASGVFDLFNFIIWAGISILRCPRPFAGNVQIPISRPRR